MVNGLGNGVGWVNIVKGLYGEGGWWMELGMGIVWGWERKTGKGMGNECWTGGCWQGIGWQSVVGGEIGRDELQGVGG